jgi:hypothetical protein
LNTLWLLVVVVLGLTAQEAVALAGSELAPGLVSPQAPITPLPLVRVGLRLLFKQIKVATVAIQYLAPLLQQAAVVVEVRKFLQLQLVEEVEAQVVVPHL